MGTSIKDLLKYKDEVPLKNKSGNVIKTVWVRIIGDSDNTAAAKQARIASTQMRASLRDTTTDDYKDQIEPIAELDRDSQEAIVISAQQNRFSAEAFIHVNKEELPKIEEFAEQPDAPTLEEQERYDAAVEQQSVDFNNKIDEYIQGRIKALKAELSEKAPEEILEMARNEMINILPLQTFFEEYNAQKVFRGTFEDRSCKIRSFETIEDFKDSDLLIKEQLLGAYTKLEISPDDIKN